MQQDDIRSACETIAKFLLKFREPDFQMLLEKSDEKADRFSSLVTVSDLAFVKSKLRGSHEFNDVVSALACAIKSDGFDRSKFEAMIKGGLRDAPGEDPTSDKGLRNSSRNQQITPMRKIINYVILSEKREDNLMGRVCLLLKEGWEPLGGVGFAALGASPIGGNRFVQAMVKYSEG